MISYNPRDWFKLIFAFHKSDTFRKLIWVMIILAFYCEAISFFSEHVYNLDWFPNSAFHSTLGFVLSMLLVFRTNTAYDRWWEGRKQWGALVNNTRNMAIKLHAYLDPEDRANRVMFHEILSAYPFALKDHLAKLTQTGTAPIDGIEEMHQPNLVAGKLFKEVNGLYMSKKITGEQLIVINEEIRSLTDVCGACERIKRSPIPYSYNLFLKKFIFIYVITMPFSFGKDFGHAIIFLTVFTFYVLASLELIAEEIEDPFGGDTNDLPLDGLSHTIKKSVAEIMFHHK